MNLLQSIDHMSHFHIGDTGPNCQPQEWMVKDKDGQIWVAESPFRHLCHSPAGREPDLPAVLRLREAKPSQYRHRGSSHGCHGRVLMGFVYATA